MWSMNCSDLRISNAKSKPVAKNLSVIASRSLALTDSLICVIAFGNLAEARFCACMLQFVWRDVCLACNFSLLKALTLLTCQLGREPGPPLRMFFATFFSLLFPIILYLEPSQDGNDHPQLGPVWSQEPKNTLFGKSFWRNDIIVNIKVLELHKWSYNPII